MECKWYTQPNNKGPKMESLSPARMRACVLIGVALWAAGCSPLSPQIFSDDMVSAPKPDGEHSAMKKDDGPTTMQQAKSSALQVMRRYNEAVKEHSALSPTIGAALIGLSALALVKSLNHSNGSDIVGLGVAGSAAYLYGSTFASRPRQMVYLTGAKALSCAIAASEPYEISKEVQDDWQRRQDSMEADAATLSLTLGKHAGLASERSVTTGGSARPAGCGAESRPQCTLRDATAEERALHDATCARARAEWDRRCVATPARTRVDAPNPALATAVAQAKQELTAADGLSRQMPILLAKLRSAPRDLSETSRRIQLNVSMEVLKTEPNLQAILASTRDLRATALTLTGSGAFKPALGPAQGAPIDSKGSVRSLDAATQTAIQEIERDTTKLRTSRRALASRVDHVLEDVRNVRTSLKDCEFIMPPAGVAPAPAADEASTPPRRNEDTAELTADDLRRLGLGADATQDQARRAISACQTLLGRPKPPTGDFDVGTRAAVRDGTACVNIARPRQG